MNCPKCSKPITQPGKYCTACGYNFGEELHDKLSFYFGLKDEFEQLGKVQDSLYSGLAKISIKIQKYEELLQRDLKRVAVPGDAKAGMPSEPIKPEPAVPLTGKGSLFEAQERPSAAETTSYAEPERKTSDFEVKLGQKWLLIVGLLTMVFGVGYFLKYSFDQGWVTPAGRVTMSYVWGVVFLIAGDRFRKKELARFGLSLIGGGIAVLYFSTFAAFQIYHLFIQAPSFVVMIMITVLAGLLSVLYDSKWLAVLGLAGGFLTPVLLTTGQDNQIALMTYMTILNLGLLGVAFRKKWDLLNALGFIFTYLLYTGWFVSHYRDHKFWPAVIFLNVFYIIYSIAPFAYQLTREKSEKIKGFLIMLPNSFIAFAYSYHMIKTHFSLPWVSVISVFYSLVFLSMASFLYRKGKHQQDAFVLLLAKATLFLIITVPIIFSKHWITLFWAAQALTLLWMGIRLDRRRLIAGAYALIGVTLYKFLVHDYSAVFRLDLVDFSYYGSYAYLLPERLLTSFFALLMLYRSGVLVKKASLDIFSSGIRDSAIIFTACGVLLFIVLNIETSAFFHDYLPQARFAAISVLWTTFSVLLMLKGFKDNNAALRKVSFGLFLVTVLKVFLFDMSNVSTPYRIISFIILGLVLVGTSYLYHKFKDKILSAVATDDRKELSE